MKNAWVNGEASQALSLLDRGLAYGDGLFETLLLKSGDPCYLERHLERLRQGANRLRMSFDEALLRAELAAFLLESERKGLLVPDCLSVLKIMITRGTGDRGYRFSNNLTCTRILMLFEHSSRSQQNSLSGICIRLCSTPISVNPSLAGIKHLNRLDCVLARSEWDNPDIQEGLMLNQQQRIVEGTLSNIFIVHQGALLTPSVEQAGVAGVMRAVILDRASMKGIQALEVEPFTIDQLMQADEVFVCNSVIGIWPVIQCDAASWPVGRMTRCLQQWIEPSHDQ
jgi:4-amino-4-deoxychorismate lyase